MCVAGWDWNTFHGMQWCAKAEKNLAHPRKLTWNLKMDGCTASFLSGGQFFRCYVMLVNIILEPEHVSFPSFMFGFHASFLGVSFFQLKVTQNNIRFMKEKRWMALLKRTY